jgi:predicted permease
MPSIAQDVRQAVRTLLKHPGYLVTAFLTLSLGIGFSTATFSVINAVLLRPLPYSKPSQLVMLRERKLPQFPEFSVAPGHYLTWRAQATAFEGIGSWTGAQVNLDTGSGEPDRVRTDRVSANLFPLLGLRPRLGRLFTEADDAAGAPPVMILSYGAWQRRFGGRADVIGQTVRVDRQPVTIVGVMPEGFVFPAETTEMWSALALSSDERMRFGSHYTSALARMKDGVSLQRANDDLNTVARRLAKERPENSGWEVMAIPMQEYSVRGVRRALIVLLGAVSLVLLIACVNVANLLLARGASRQKELAIRAAVGASRLRLIRQLLVEQITLSAASAIGGLLVAAWTLRGLLALLPNALPRQSEIRLDAPVLGFAVILAFITPIVFGLLPAVQASRPDVRDLLASGGRQSGSIPGRRLRRLLVVAEMALAMMLLIGAGLLIRSFGKLSDVSPGFDPSNAFVVGIDLSGGRYPEGEARERFFAELRDRIQHVPQVSAVGMSRTFPMMNDFVSTFEIEGRAETRPQEGHGTSTTQPITNFYAVDSGYFAAMGIPLLKGRTIAESDRRGSPRVLVINQTLAAKFFPHEDPIGHRLRVSQGPNDWREIVGVVGDVKQYGLASVTPEQVYESYRQHPYLTSYQYVVRSAADAAALVPTIRAIVKNMDAEIPLSSVRTLDDLVSTSIRSQRFSATLITVFSVAALLLAALGVYGVVAYTVGLRTQEFAIRLAHGARRSHILALVLRGALTMSAIGVGVGIAGAYVLRGTLETLLFGITPGDLITYLTVGLVLTLVAVVASVLPAWRATRVDPVAALRNT